ncbi:hypothetical protein EJ110_NYTH29428 [Nymphaea thermarum]|nr:hypothetical protein EJ110_NYTH29428 [Nymphaea thermarum]
MEFLDYKASPSAIDTVSEDRGSHVEGGSVDTQATAARDNLFGQVYVRKQKVAVEDVEEVAVEDVEDVDRTNPSSVTSPNDPSPLNEELPIALRKGTRAHRVLGGTRAQDFVLFLLESEASPGPSTRVPRGAGLPLRVAPVVGRYCYSGNLGYLRKLHCSDVAACNGSQEIPLPAYVKHQCQQLLDAVKASRIEKDMKDAEEGYGDPNELEESEGEDVQLEQDVGVSLETAKGKGIMHGGGSSATATRKRRGASVTSVSRGRGRSQGRTGGGTVPTMKSSNMSDSWVEEEPAAILDEDDLDFLNVEGAAEIVEVEEGEAGGGGAMEC